MADDKKIAFVPSSELKQKLDKLQHEMKLESPAEVISLALSMLEISLGRDVELADNTSRYKISRFAKYNQTVSFEDHDDGSGSQD